MGVEHKMHQNNSIIITNSEFAYYKNLCNGDTEDIQREGIQAIIRQTCAEGRLLLNGQIDYLKQHLPNWICSRSAKVRMWSLWLATLVNDQNIESTCLQSMDGEKDPQFIAPTLAILSMRHNKSEYEKAVRKLEDKYLQTELNETVLNISSALFAREPFYKTDKNIMKSLLSEEGLMRWGAVWIPVYYAYPYLTKKRNLHEIVAKELVCELFNIKNSRINEYAMWCLCLHGNAKEKDLPISLHDYKKLDSSVLKWYFQIILSDESIRKNTEYILELLSGAINYSIDVKEGLLRGLESVQYHKEFVESIVSWFLCEKSSQIRRLLLMRMIQYVEIDMQFEETYFEVLVDEYSRRKQESDFIGDYLKLLGKNSALVIIDNKLLPTFGCKIKQIGGIYYMETDNKRYEKIADSISIEALQINTSSGNVQNNYFNHRENDDQLVRELITGLETLESMEEISESLLQEIQDTKVLIQSGINESNKLKLGDFLTRLSAISTIVGASPVFIEASNKVVNLISTIIN